MTKRRKQFLFFISFLLILMIEVCIAIYIQDGFIRNYMGDVLAVIVVYFFIRIFIPNGWKWLPLYVFLFSVGVEITQYFHLVKLLGMKDNRAISIILGGVFDWMDILCYGTGSLIISAASAICRKKRLK